MMTIVRAVAYTANMAMFVISMIGASTSMFSNGLSWIDYGASCKLQLPDLSSFAPFAQRSEDGVKVFPY